MNSPIKWVGGKRREIKYFAKYIPKFNTYVEPFFGGGALFWHLSPECAEINDINTELMNFYKVLRDKPNELHDSLQKYELTKEFFNNVVYILNNKLWESEVHRASIFYYLNKTSFSGKWRLNKRGLYNNTWGRYTKERYKEISHEHSRLLNNVSISNLEYVSILEKHKDIQTSFIFLDPPYLECDTMYTETQDFVCIYEYISKYIKSCKCKVMLIVKSNDYLEKLFKEHIVDTYNVAYSHNAKSDKTHKHLVICNY